MKTTDFVSLRDAGIRCQNFYWHKYAAHGLTKEDIIAAGLRNDDVVVHPDIIAPLLAVREALAASGLTLFVKEGYRSPALYQIVYQRRVEKYGKEETDRLFNMQDMPHASGTSVDVALWSIVDDKEVYMRDSADGAPALFVDFYRGKTDAASQRFQQLQDDLAGLMLAHGFRLGTRREYFHFDWTGEPAEHGRLASRQ